MVQSAERIRQEGPEAIPVRRNPYLVNYEQQRQKRVGMAGNTGRQAGAARGAAGDMRRQAGAVRGTAYGSAGVTGNTRRTCVARGTARRQAALRRRRARQRRMLVVGLWVFCMLLAGILVFAGRPREAALAKESKTEQPVRQADSTAGKGKTQKVQGLAEEVYAQHPDWTEDFLTPNEYSRPGEALPEVRNIFVHYTANPGTSAAQNRSYFEQQKDTHQASVSAHFIIGYEGEILQCLPLDEIGYAVQTRNYDSVSIECCYKASDGSFTKETYDSLIALLAWLTDVYGLDTEDILRHYDCGRKKCPLYYTEHPDAWERLKEDVADRITENQGTVL